MPAIRRPQGDVAPPAFAVMEDLDLLDQLAARTTNLQAGSLRRGRAIEIAAVVGILIVVAVAAAWLIGQAIPLGWDEAVYASKSRSLLTDTQSSTCPLHRAPGLPIVGLWVGRSGSRTPTCGPSRSR